MAADEGDWECPHCTLSNSAGSRICEACANPRASGGDGADASPPDVVEEAPPENMWCCAVCTYHNAMFSSRCVICTQGTRPEHLAGDATQVDPATEFTRVFGDGDTSVESMMDDTPANYNAANQRHDTGPIGEGDDGDEDDEEGYGSEGTNMGATGYDGPGMDLAKVRRKKKKQIGRAHV